MSSPRWANRKHVKNVVLRERLNLIPIFMNLYHVFGGLKKVTGGIYYKTRSLFQILNDARSFSFISDRETNDVAMIFHSFHHEQAI